MTFEEYYNNWLLIKNKHKLSPRRYYWYERSLKLFTDYFGSDILLKNIKRTEYQKFLNNYGEGRTKETVRKVNGCISPCLKDAIYDGYLKKDPTYNIDLNGTKLSKKEEYKYMTIKHYLELIEYFKSRNEQSYIFLYLMAVTGARYSDLINMTRKDLNKGTGIIHLPGSKTKHSKRDVEVNPEDIKLINIKLSKLPVRFDGKIFKLSHSAVKKAFNHAKKEIGFEDDSITPYALRHTHTSYLLSKYIPIEYICKRLGHANISITLEMYSHLLEEHKKGKVKVTENYSLDTYLTPARLKPQYYKG